MTNFEALGLSPTLVRTVQSMGFDTPTPIQVQAIPLVLRGRDVLGLAQTGTGKTAAFGLPLAQSLMAEHGRPEALAVRSLILAPTRELVNQIADNLKAFVRGTPIKVNVVVGGASIINQMRMLQRGSDILVATPGRLIDLLDRRAVNLATARYLVLDEADQMLDMGFIHALRRIASVLSPRRQTLLFSATMPKLMEDLSRAYLNDPARIEVSPPGRAVDKIAQSVHYLSNRSKADLLRDCLSANPGALSLVFARTKHGAEKLMKHLVERGFAADSIHGNKSQSQRDRAIKAFRAGQTRVLVATDVAARGIDIPGVSHVYNYDLPEVPENYVHRIGRTARAGAEGLAVAFCAPAEQHLLAQIETLMGMRVPVASGTPDPDAEPAPRGGRGARPGPGRGAQGGGRGAKPAAQGHGKPQGKPQGQPQGQPQGRPRRPRKTASRAA